MMPNKVNNLKEELCQVQAQVGKSVVATDKGRSIGFASASDVGLW